MDYSSYKYLWDQEQIILFMVGLLSGKEEYAEMVPERIWDDIFTKFLSIQDNDVD